MAHPTNAASYKYPSATARGSHAYLIPAVRKALGDADDKRLFELGCGNGSMANVLTGDGWDVTGVDVSTEGIAHANSAYPGINLSIGSAYDDLAGLFGQFPVVLSLEVVEHLYDPRAYAATLFDLAAPGGQVIVSTPYHGYWKNLALALSGKMDKHFTALWDNGHIKFWSVDTLGHLLREAGFGIERVYRVGRLPALAKSMVMVARKAG